MYYNITSMKVGTITTPNQKGQVVIPQNYRKLLGISQHTPLNILVRGGGLYLYPVKEALTFVEEESSYLEVLERTQGTWKGDASVSNTKKKKTELKASFKRKQS